MSDAVSVGVSVVNGRVVVCPYGEFDLFTLPRLRDALLEACREGLPVVVDLGGVRFIDLTAIDLIDQARTRLRAAGSDLMVANPSPLALKVLRLSRRDDLAS